MESRNDVEILLVEDNADDADLVLRVLKKMNLYEKTVHVMDGEAALEKLVPGISPGVPKVLPKLIMLDIKMPKVDGLTVLKTLKDHALTRTIPVLVLSSSNQEEDVNTAYQFGANSYVVKPVNYDSFITTIESTIHFWMFINNHPLR